MASGSRTETHVEGNVKTTYSYSIDTSGFGYSIIDDESGIRDDFKFLIEEMPNKLTEIQRYLDTALGITTAFEFNDVKDVSNAVTELTADINSLKGTLVDLFNAFMIDIDNVNAELAYNFGWVRIGKIKGSQRSENIPTEQNN